MRFRCLYTAFASLQKEQDFDINSCDKHMTKIANRNNGLVRDVLLFDFDVVLATISTMLQYRRCYDIDDAAIFCAIDW